MSASRGGLFEEFEKIDNLILHKYLYTIQLARLKQQPFNPKSRARMN